MRYLAILYFFLTVGIDCSYALLKEVCFSPGDCCEKNIIELIKGAQSSIDIAIYAFSNDEIYKYLLQAKKRGLDIKIVTDSTQSKGRHSLVPKLRKDGFKIRIKKIVRIEHNKFAVFDRKALIMGSYNWTRSASKYNSENCLAVHDLHIVVKYQKRFEELWTLYDPNEISMTKKPKRRGLKKFMSRSRRNRQGHSID